MTVRGVIEHARPMWRCSILTPAPADQVAHFIQELALLPARQMQVLRGVVNGLSAKEIAFQLGISPRTVEVHREKILLKLGVRRTVELVRLAAQVDSSDHVGIWRCGVANCSCAESTGYSV